MDRYRGLDRVAQLAIAAAQQTLKALPDYSALGCVSVGSSRGATISLEKSISDFAADPSKVPIDTSPKTTAGNLSSWVAQECLAQRSPDERAAAIATVSTSMTCSSAFHSLLTSLAFVKSGLSPVALFGGAESCLTPFTIAHLEALRIYAEGGVAWPCRPGGSKEGLANTVALGEGAGTALLLADDGSVCEGDLELLGIGWAIEETPSATGVSSDGLAFERAMAMALSSMPSGRRVDTVIAHAPGSIKGDEAELRAISRVFGDVMVCSTKHLTGHTYGASGMVSMALAQNLLLGGRWGGFPYQSRVSPFRVERPEGVLINTAGFGGNCISVVLGAPQR
jgi:3-oxoacyl-(acyl-carrier-protein) synthase